MFHFGMTGFLKYFKNIEDEPKHNRFLIKFSNGYHLVWDNQRLLGKVKLIDSIDDFIEKNNLGLEESAIFAQSVRGNLKRRYKMRITSLAFKNNESIPAKYTCQGQDINPPLKIEDIPDAAQFLALIVDDPDAPMGTWVHWVVFNMSKINEIGEGIIPGKQGMNSFGKKNYGGPCPPSGTHRYFFRLYALDSELGLDEGANCQELDKAMQGHIVEQAEIIGKYQKK